MSTKKKTLTTFKSLTAWSLIAPLNLFKTSSEIRHLSIKSLWWSKYKSNGDYNMEAILFFPFVKFIMKKNNKT